MAIAAVRQYAMPGPTYWLRQYSRPFFIIRASLNLNNIFAGGIIISIPPGEGLCNCGR